MSASFKIALSQSGYPADGDVVAQARAIVERAADAGCELVVFPENFMWPRKLSPAEIAGIAEPVDGSFVRALAEVARQAGIWLAFTVNECNLQGGKPYNTAVVADDAGQVRGSYRKCHLYDALGQRESDRLTRGGEPSAPVGAPFATLGLQVCYDLRFPEPARALALEGCNLLLYPAAWHDGPSKADQWETLLRARAVENELYVAGVCRAGRGFSGRSLLVDPMGRVVARAGDANAAGKGAGNVPLPTGGMRLGDACASGHAADASGGAEGAPEGLVIGEINLDLVSSTRKNMPVFAHRRPELYGRLTTE